jgi:transcriptional regulator with XRE-family HTH domain
LNCLAKIGKIPALAGRRRVKKLKGYCKGGRAVVDTDAIYYGIWKLAVERMREDYWKTNPDGPQLKQKDIAKKTGVSQRSISRYLSDHPAVAISLREILKILANYNVGVDELAEITGDEKLAAVLHGLLNDRDKLEKLAEIIESSNEGWNSILSYIDLIHSQITRH